MFGLQLPLFFSFLKKSSLVFIIASICILHVYVYAYEYTTQRWDHIGTTTTDQNGS